VPSVQKPSRPLRTRRPAPKAAAPKVVNRVRTRPRSAPTAAASLRRSEREVVVITGGSAGIGRATAQAFARRQAWIAVLARSEERLSATAKEIERAGGRALSLPTDVADPAQVEAAAEAVEREFGPIDVWINNAMATVFAPLDRLTPEEYRRVTEVTYLGTVYGTMAALKCMRPRNRGTIVQVGSALSYRAIPLQSPYCGAKFAIRGFTDSLRSELIHDGLDIHLTMVQLPAINTPQFDWSRNKMSRRPRPMPPVFDPEVAARAILYAARARPREVFVGGPTLGAAFGNALAPSWFDRLLARRAYGGQMSDRPTDAATPDNLFAPAPGDFAVRGSFGDEARRRSWELELLMAISRLTSAVRLMLGGLDERPDLTVPRLRRR
jgi:NAD(P)-dependent dehydrogenase (short-subunit alcohol dehydrogenase family)